MSQITKIDKLNAKIAELNKNSNMTSFDEVVVVYLGASVKEHFPKLRDEQGNKLKDEKGNDRRSEKSDGYTYTFSQVGTSKVVKVVAPQMLKFTVLGSYSISGLGYDISAGNMIFIEKDVKISPFQ